MTNKEYILACTRKEEESEAREVLLQFNELLGKLIKLDGSVEIMLDCICNEIPAYEIQAAMERGYDFREMMDGFSDWQLEEELEARKEDRSKRED